MKHYDFKCPVCETVNKDLFLEETDGWMICEHCGAEVEDKSFSKRQLVRIPILTLEQLSRRLSAREAV